VIDGSTPSSSSLERAQCQQHLGGGASYIIPDAQWRTKQLRGVGIYPSFVTLWCSGPPLPPPPRSIVGEAPRDGGATAVVVVSPMSSLSSQIGVVFRVLAMCPAKIVFSQPLNAPFLSLLFRFFDGRTSEGSRRERQSSSPHEGQQWQSPCGVSCCGGSGKCQGITFSCLELISTHHMSSPHPLNKLFLSAAFATQKQKDGLGTGRCSVAPNSMVPNSKVTPAKRKNKYMLN